MFCHGLSKVRAEGGRQERGMEKDGKRGGGEREWGRAFECERVRVR